MAKKKRPPHVITIPKRDGSTVTFRGTRKTTKPAGRRK